MDKILALLEYIEDEPKTWNEIYQRCQEIDIDPDHARAILTDPRNPLVIQQASGVRPNLRGHQMVNDSRKSMVNVAPYEDETYGRIKFGKWLMFKLYHTFNHDMKGFAEVTSLLTIGTALPIIFFGYPITRPLISYPLLYASVFSLAMVAYLGWGTYFWSSETKCPKCGERFRFIRTRRVLTDERKLSDAEIRSYKNTYTCKNPECNYQEVRDESKTIRKDTY